MKIAMASDHGGFDRKEELKEYLTKKGFDVVDVGTYSKDSCHYPEFAIKCAKLVQKGECKYGIIVCTSGEGVAITANKIKGIRVKQGNSGLDLQSFLPQGILPHFYEIKLSRKAFLNPAAWAQEHISAMSEDAQAYFQEKESALALYLLALLKVIDIVFIACAFALLAFGFFVEVKYLPVTVTERFYAVGASIFAYGFAFGFIYILLTFLKMLPLTPYNPFTLMQIICFLFCLLFGRSLAKWGKF